MSQTPEMREAIARIIDPSSWQVLDSYLERVKRHYPHGGYDPDNFTDKASLAKADAILALSAPSPVVEGQGSSGGRVRAAPDGATDKPNAAGWFAYRGWWIDYDPPPIPVRSCDWHFWHNDFDGAPDANDSRHGHASSLEDAKSQIDDCEDDQ